jgi:hypothetical protein
MKTLNKLSMTTLILNHLLDKETITSVEAQALYRCRSLSKRISELKSEGWTINSVLKTDVTGQRYARYQLGK